MDGVKYSNLFTIASKRIKKKKNSERNLTKQLKELYTEKGNIFKKKLMKAQIRPQALVLSKHEILRCAIPPSASWLNSHPGHTPYWR